MSTNEDRTHPSYGLVQFSRIGSTGKRLFASPLESHIHLVRVRVSGARVVDRGDGETGYMADKTHVEFDLSAAQFADAITTMNVIPGTPCTILRIGGESIPDPPRELNRADAVEDAAARRVERAHEALRCAEQKVSETLATSKIPKAQQVEIQRAMQAFVMAATDGLPWMIERMRNEMAGVVTAAKREVDAAVTLMVHQAGIAALLGGQQTSAPLALTVGGEVGLDGELEDVVRAIRFPPEAEVEEVGPDVELEEARRELQW